MEVLKTYHLDEVNDGSRINCIRYSHCGGIVATRALDGLAGG